MQNYYFIRLTGGHLFLAVSTTQVELHDAAVELHDVAIKIHIWIALMMKSQNWSAVV